MKLQVTKKTTEELEVETPSYYRQNWAFYAITEASVMTVGDDTIWVTRSKESPSRFAETVQDVIKGEIITREQFIKAYHKAQKTIAEHFTAIEALEGLGALAD